MSRTEVEIGKFDVCIGKSLIRNATSSSVEFLCFAQEILQVFSNLQSNTTKPNAILFTSGAVILHSLFINWVLLTGSPQCLRHGHLLPPVEDSQWIPHPRIAYCKWDPVPLPPHTWHSPFDVCSFVQPCRYGFAFLLCSFERLLETRTGQTPCQTIHPTTGDRGGTRSYQKRAMALTTFYFLVAAVTPITHRRRAFSGPPQLQMRTRRVQHLAVEDLVGWVACLGG